MRHRSARLVAAIAAMLVVAGCTSPERTVDRLAVQWAEKISADVTNVASMNNKTPATLSNDELATIKTLNEEIKGLKLTLTPGRIELAIGGGTSCVTLSGGLYTKSVIEAGACPTTPLTAAPFLQESEDQGHAIVALQKWSATTLADRAWDKVDSIDGIAQYVQAHLATTAKGVVFDQPNARRLRATYGTGTWCATFGLFENGAGIKLESCSSPLDDFSPTQAQAG